jgi:hypothetical protein
VTVSNQNHKNPDILNKTGSHSKAVYKHLVGTVELEPATKRLSDAQETGIETKGAKRTKDIKGRMKKGD